MPTTQFWQGAIERVLLKEVWDIGSDLHTRTVDVHVSRLWRSLIIGPDIGYYIKTIYHHGYQLEKIEE